MNDNDESRIKCSTCGKLFYRLMTNEDRCGLCVNASAFQKSPVKKLESIFNSSFIIDEVVFRRSIRGEIFVNEILVEKDVVQALVEFLK